MAEAEGKWERMDELEKPTMVMGVPRLNKIY